jgi:hypothetical protein
VPATAPRWANDAAGPPLRDDGATGARTTRVRRIALSMLLAVLAGLLVGCSLSGGSQDETSPSPAKSPIPLRHAPIWVRDACGGFPAPIRTHCPAMLPASATAGSTLSFVKASPREPINILAFESGGERSGNQRLNRPPHYVAVALMSGTLDRALPTIFRKLRGPPAGIHDGLANSVQRRALLIGRRRWGDISGGLELGPSTGRIPLTYFHYLWFRWGTGHDQTAIGLHVWEPFTEVVGTLHALVDRLAPAPPRPLSLPPDSRPLTSPAMTRSPPWLRDACRALRTRPICPAEIPVAQPQVDLFYEPHWKPEQDYLSVSWGTPHGIAFTENHPPQFLHIDLTAGDVPIDRRFAHETLHPRDGLMRLTGQGEAGGAAIPLGHPQWAGVPGTLVLGDCFSNHLCYRWSAGASTYQVDIHGWEPFTQTVSALRRTVESIPRR